jgi:hypothetical protein
MESWMRVAECNGYAATCRALECLSRPTAGRPDPARPEPSCGATGQRGNEPSTFGGQLVTQPKWARHTGNGGRCSPVDPANGSRLGVGSQIEVQNRAPRFVGLARPKPGLLVAEDAKEGGCNQVSAFARLGG